MSELSESNKSPDQVISLSSISIPMSFFANDPMQMKPIYRIEDDPTAMIPLLPGETYHIGYIPFSEEEAFAKASIGINSPFKKLSPLARNRPIIIKRSATNAERLIMLIHKFIYCTCGAERIMPKHDFHHIPRSLLYYKLRYMIANGYYSLLSLDMQAENNSGEEVFEITVSLTYGFASVHSAFVNNLKTFIESDGKIFVRAKMRDIIGELDDDQEEDYGNDYNGQTGYVRQLKHKVSTEGIVNTITPHAIAKDVDTLSTSVNQPETSSTTQITIPKPQLVRQTNDEQCYL